MNTIRTLFATTCLALLLSACVTTEENNAKAPATPIEKILTEAHRNYDEGNYDRTIQSLTNFPELRYATKEQQIDAHKLTAFSYCVMGQANLCRQEFRTILKINPKFDLTPAEKNHPIWGLAFEAARKNN